MMLTTKGYKVHSAVLDLRNDFFVLRSDDDVYLSNNVKAHKVDITLANEQVSVCSSCQAVDLNKLSADLQLGHPACRVMGGMFFFYAF